MPKKKKIAVLLAVLAVISVITIIISNSEEKKEDIKTNGEVVLEINPGDVTNLSLTINSKTLSFTKDDSWIYDDDNNYPLDDTKISDLLGIFKSFSSTFVIENVTDYSQYGLSNPKCIINISTADKDYTIKLGNISKMDEQRYVDIGDGNVYLTASDPYESYDIELSSLILNDTIPSFKEVTSITFNGSQNYTIIKEDGTSLCDDDKYFTDGNPLDNDLVDDYISTIKNLELYNCVSYNVSEQELKEYGLDNPELTITIVYTSKEKEENQSLTLYISSNVEELEKYNNTIDDDKDVSSITRYIRVNDSQIVYSLSSTKYDTLTKNSYDNLRHQEAFPGDFDTVTSIDITLEGSNYTFTKENDTWKYNDEEIEMTTLRNSITSLNVDKFTSDKINGQKEVSITLHLDNENFPEYKIDFYRYNGDNCLVCVGDKPYAYVARSSVVDIIEAINKIILA